MIRWTGRKEGKGDKEMGEVGGDYGKGIKG